jgi:phosphoglycerate dehydrogenase-like enzyme
MHILMMTTPHRPSPEHLRRLKATGPAVEITVAETVADSIKASKSCEVIFGHRFLRQCLPFTENLRWVQTTSGGVDRLPCGQLEEKNVLLTRFTLSSSVVARHAVTLAYCITRAIPEAKENQSRKHWKKTLDFLPFPRRAIIFGTGNIGCAIARILKADGLQVFGVKKHPFKRKIAEFDEIYTGDSWRIVLKDMDWCFLALPHRDDTKNFFDEASLRSLPKHAVVVNVGRGETLDHVGLIRVLKEGHIGGAALDVLPNSDEPLDSESILWETPRLLLTPHVAAYDPKRRELVEKFCEEQLDRYLNGLTLKDIVIPIS